MITTFAINENNDLYIGPGGGLAMLSGAPAVGQNCVTAVQAQLGEMIYAKNQGMPSRATMWDNYRPQQFLAAVRKIILGVNGVNTVTSLTGSKTDSTFAYSATIETIYGSAIVNGNV